MCSRLATTRRLPSKRVRGGHGAPREMSLINKMLQDLDRRHSGDPVAEGAMPAHVRTVAAEPRGREWFWRVLAFLLVIAIGWVAWVAYQIWPRPVVTELAYQSAAQAKARPATLVAPAPPAPETAPAPAPVAAVT